MSYRTPNLLARFARAIEAVNEEAAKIIAESKAADVKRPRTPAGHTDAFGDQQDYDDEKAHGWAAERGDQ